MIESSSSDGEDEPSVTLGEFEHRRSSPTKSISIDSHSTDSISITADHSHGGSPRVSISNLSRTSSALSLADGLDPEDEHSENLQIYIVLARCIAYPFTAKQSTEKARCQTKVTKKQLELVKERVQQFLSGHLNIPHDEAFKNSMEYYYNVFLCNEGVAKMVASGAYSANDFREVFKANICRRIQSLSVEGLSADHIINSWLNNFDKIYRGNVEEKRVGQTSTMAASELALSKEQLYDMFQTILSINKYEHQKIFNECQLDNPDEQAACIRREFKAWEEAIEGGLVDMMPLFSNKESEKLFIADRQSWLKKQMESMDTVPVMKTTNESFLALSRILKRNPASVETSAHDDSLSRVDLTLDYQLTVIVKEVSGLKSMKFSRPIYVVMRVEQLTKLQFDCVDTARHVFDSQGEWKTQCPVPSLKMKVMMPNTSTLSLDDKLLAQRVLHPYCGMAEGYDWYQLTPHKGWVGDPIKIRLLIRFEKPANYKKAGYLYVEDKTNRWKTWQRRYIALFQVSLRVFALCSYQESLTKPNSTLSLEGYTVDYCEPVAGYSGGKFFFKALKEGSEVLFATDDEAERTQWVNKLYTATGQTHKPHPVVAASPALLVVQDKHIEMEGKRLTPLKRMIQRSPLELDMNRLFEKLMRWTLAYRLNDSYSCLGWLTPGQSFVLEEFCNRYSFHSMFHRLVYLQCLMDQAESGILIDPNLLSYLYSYCHSQQSPSSKESGLVTVDEIAMFKDIRSRLEHHLCDQITHFRYSFPFGRPENALKLTIALYEKVALHVHENEISQAMIRRCFQQAALVNYTRLTKYAGISDLQNHNVQLEVKKSKTFQLAELCIEFLQQNEEHHGETFAAYTDIMVEHCELFWSMFGVDLDLFLSVQPEGCWYGLEIFQLLNSYFGVHPVLKEGEFHTKLCQKFLPVLLSYLDVSQMSLLQAMEEDLTNETWIPMNNSCTSSENLQENMDKLRKFTSEFHWPASDASEKVLIETLSKIAEHMVVRYTESLTGSWCDWVSGISDSLDYLLDTELCVMLNALSQVQRLAREVCISHKEGSNSKLSRSESTKQDVSWSESEEEQGDHTDVFTFLAEKEDTMILHLVDKMNSHLRKIMKVLSFYDSDSLLSFCTFLIRFNKKAGSDFTCYMATNLEQVLSKVHDNKLISKISKVWLNAIISVVHPWIQDRVEMPFSAVQVIVLSDLIMPLPSTFSRYGISEQEVFSADFDVIRSKVQVELALLNITKPGIVNQNISSTD